MATLTERFKKALGVEPEVAEVAHPAPVVPAPKQKRQRKERKLGPLGREAPLMSLEDILRALHGGEQMKQQKEHMEVERKVRDSGIFDLILGSDVEPSPPPYRSPSPFHQDHVYRGEPSPSRNIVRYDRMTGKIVPVTEPPR